MNAARRLALPASAALTALAGGCVGSSSPPRQVARPVVQSTANANTYVVRSGDTLSEIAQNQGVGMRELARANGIAPPYLIRIGQRLRIPSRNLSYREPARPAPMPMPRPAPTPAPVRPYVTPAPRPTSLPTPGPVRQARTKIPGAPGLTWPTDGPLASRFGSLVNGEPNNGIDMTAYPGMAVRASAAGTVIFAGQESRRFGKTVIVDHGDGWMTVYAYLGQLTVSAGEKVRQRTRIAFVGKSGEARVPKVHYELRHDNVPVDPQLYLPGRL
ncbi:M23 family metallopeptidase [Novosphingobium sp. ZN18A2]|uniref:M23 family metallopeptidase n=1 Tax=Novosphingobium sp. ZN18A2 TaxID=3079861 RepID=UPI0030CE66AD